MRHRTVAANGIDLHVVEEGQGRPVILAHGFPELWYSWRHQMPALAEAGYRAVALDMRGFGETSIPDDPDAYDSLTVGDDLIGLLDDLGEERGVFVGHDWGAGVTWNLALAHPERVEAVVGMSVPYVPRAPAPPTDIMRRHLGEDFYIVWFQEPGVADAALARDVRRTILTNEVWTAKWAERDEEPRLPPWMSDDDLRVYVEAFERTGFTGGLNYYRNIDRSWKLLERYGDRKIEQPALFITGSRDPVKRFSRAEAMDGWVTDLRVKEIEGAGHWVQQQSPDEVNAALLDFLSTVHGPQSTRRR
ncbi:MAG: alpha/beta fold hydrolase [Thermoleophilaceae bacterium]